MKVWILYALPDEDSAVLEVFASDTERRPGKRYAVSMFGGGALYEYDVGDREELLNGKLLWVADGVEVGR